MENKIVVALKAIIVHNKKVLTIQRSSQEENGAGMWEFVGGKLEFGETLEDGLKREIREEVGFDACIERLLFATQFQTSSNRQVVLLTYLATCDEETVCLSEEHDDYLWANRAQLISIITKPILQDIQNNHVFSLLDIE